MKLIEPPSRPKKAIQKTDWWFMALLALIAVGLSLWPTLHGFWVHPPGQQYVSTIVPDMDDGPVYFGFIEQNSQGHFFYRNVFTSEAQHAVLWNPLWFLLGTLKWVSGWSAPMVFLVGRIVFGLGLVSLIVWLTRQFFPE